MKNIYSFALALFISQIIFSQAAPDIEWQKTIGANGNEYVEGIEESPDGGIVICGNSNSVATGDKSEDTDLYWDYWVVKLDNVGNIEWENTIGGSSYDISQAMTVTPEGEFLLAGTSYSNASGDKSEHSKGGADYWIVKIDAEGEIIWEKTVGGSQHDELTTINYTSDGGCIVGGYSFSGISADKTEPVLGGYDFWIVKLDSDGNVEWDETIGGSSDDLLRTVKQTNDGGYILSGSSYSNISSDKAENSIGSSDYWLVKISESGNIEWQNTIGSTSQDEYFSMDMTADGGYILGGHSSGGISGDKSEASNGSSDYWIVKTDSNGYVQWDNSIGGTDYETLINLKSTLDGGYIIGGTSYSGVGGDKSENSYGFDDYWIVKTNELGNIEWDITLGGSNSDEMRWLIQASDESFVAAGHSFSDISGIKTESSNGLNDYWVVKLFPEENPPCSTAPASLYADFISSTTAKLHWSADPDAVKYKVQYRKSTIASWTNTNASSNVKNLFSLEPSTTYKFRIKSLCGPGLTSDWSAVGTFTTTPLKEGEFTSENIEIQIYPNPNSGIFQLELTGIQTEENISLRMFNLLGEEMYNETISNADVINQSIELNSNIENGMYFLEIKTGEKIFTEQFIISK